MQHRQAAVRSIVNEIKQAENGVEGLRAFEDIAKRVGYGKVRVTVHAGKVTSIVAEQNISPKTLPTANGQRLADLAAALGYGGFEVAIEDGRVVDIDLIKREKYVA